MNSSEKKKRAIVFVDGNNWYHNLKKMIKKPREIKIKKLSEQICNHFNLDLKGIKYYNSIPNIEDGEEVYYKHMVFLANLKRDGIEVKTRKLRRLKEKGIIVRVEKGIDLMIGCDIIEKCLIDRECDCAVLVSGDSDFIPVMNLVKKQGKEVLTVCSAKGYATELMKGEFRFWILKKQELNICSAGK